MIRALYSAATGMRAQETNIDVVANNLANVNTTGFKKSRADFQDLMYQYLQEPGAPNSSGTAESPSGIQVGLGVKTASATTASRIPARRFITITFTDFGISGTASN